MAPTDWQGLVEAGLASIEQLAGDTWTDLNDHDPGVTLLQALAYAITDLGYRAEHPIADLLTGPDGRIDLEGGCLFPPERLFPCAPVTLLDLRKYLLDELPGLANVWIDRLPSDDPVLGGRYRVWLLPAGSGGPTGELLASATRLLDAMRPLGDVFDEVALFSPGDDAGQFAPIQLALALEATISVACTAQDLLQRAQAAVTAALAPPIAFQPHTAGPSPDDAAYDGPWLAHGTLDDAALWAPRQPADVEQLVREALEGVDGLDDLASLSIAFLPARPTAALPPQAYTWDAYAGGNQLVFNGRSYDPAAAGYPGPASAAPAPARLAPDDGASAAPAGVFVDAGRYDAVQDSLPPIYGLEKHGLGPNEPAQRLAEVRQLRGYLFVFEQILADRFAQLAHARRLLSWRDEPTYVWQSLAGLTGADEVLAGAPGSGNDTPYAAGIRAIVTSWNQAYGQGDAVADHLLARFAEALPSRDWQNYETLAQKRRFLARYPAFSQHRHVGFDRARAREQGYPDVENVSWLERRVNLLLAAGPREPLCAYPGDTALQASAADGYQLYLGRAYYLLEHPLLLDGSTPAAGSRHGCVALPKAFFAGRISHVLGNWTFRELRPEFQAYVEAFLLDAAPAHLVHHFLWSSPAELDAFARGLAAWYRDGLPPLTVEDRDADTLWVRPSGAAWELVCLLRGAAGASV
ncbi:MAG TPA: hypothetical protein VFP84_34580 [Kofleriaceae bacterium]|nr:hypothetical protein [Kofleriaceae bacterium]